MRFFIRDCNGQIVGNPKGYETMRGAQAQTANWRSPAARAIADAFQARAADDQPNNYSSIKAA
jgi:hypothetical protein